MPERPDLPMSYRRGTTMYDVMPDSKPMTWSIWDLDGWIGDIRLDSNWSYQGKESGASGPFDSWQEAVVGLLDSRVD